MTETETVGLWKASAIRGRWKSEAGSRFWRSLMSCRSKDAKLVLHCRRKGHLLGWAGVPAVTGSVYADTVFGRNWNHFFYERFEFSPMGYDKYAVIGGAEKRRLSSLLQDEGFFYAHKVKGTVRRISVSGICKKQQRISWRLQSSTLPQKRR